MPHQCVRCNSFFEDEAKEVLDGCSCGGKLFFFVKQEALEDAKKQVENLTKADKLQIEEDVLDLIGDRPDEEVPVVLDMESIKVSKAGRFDLDLVRLFDKKEPLVYKLEEGKYMIDIPTTLAKRRS
jgi:predicted  nucleic acid-binding Zn-ribbon protein